MKFNINYFKKILNNPIFNRFDYIYIYSDFRYLLSQNLNNKNFVSQFLNIFLQRKKTLILPSFSYSKKNPDLEADLIVLGLVPGLRIWSFRISPNFLTAPML